mmetsp:Transcript_7381/g.20667  ORF Transcript_7381/g.20667 Transcript_7381/m.20667 type:complete len:226 (-) Transcript_7381:1049-1726(-)
MTSKRKPRLSGGVSTWTFRTREPARCLRRPARMSGSLPAAFTRTTSTRAPGGSSGQASRTSSRARSCCAQWRPPGAGTSPPPRAPSSTKNLFTLKFGLAGLFLLQTKGESMLWTAPSPNASVCTVMTSDSPFLAKVRWSCAVAAATGSTSSARRRPGPSQAAAHSRQSPVKPPTSTTRSTSCGLASARSVISSMKETGQWNSRLFRTWSEMMSRSGITDISSLGK